MYAKVDSKFAQVHWIMLATSLLTLAQIVFAYRIKRGSSGHTRPTVNTTLPNPVLKVTRSAKDVIWLYKQTDNQNISATYGKLPIYNSKVRS